RLILGDVETAVDSFLTDVAHRYEQRGVDPLRPLLTPEQLWLKKDELFAHFKQKPQVNLSLDSIEEKAGRTNLPVVSLPDLSVQH
ncbi:hypothetical protein AB4347_19120, partial [Vibrio breoganii]